jgi:ribosomal 30S subunit maturation factor RimM
MKNMQYIQNEQIATDESLQYCMQLFDSMSKNNLWYIYRGRFTQKISDTIITIAEQNMHSTQEQTQIRKRVFAILVECLQNILRHQAAVETQDLLPATERLEMLAIQKKDGFYQITSGNVIETSLVPSLQELLEKINSLDRDALKEFYLDVLNSSTVSDKGGAGLGLIDIARKSHSELLYDFKPISERFSYFYLHTTIPHPVETVAFDFKTIQGVHEIVHARNIMLVYSGKLHQENLMNLLSITNGLHYGEYDMKKKVFNIMVEMLQNIVKHGAKLHEEDKGNPAIFYVQSVPGAFILCSGNYIHTQCVEKLTTGIDYVNSLTSEQLNEYYIAQLLNFEIDTHKESGLGIIDLCIKSSNKIKYYVAPSTQEVSFFTMQVTVNIPFGKK